MTKLANEIPAGIEELKILDQSLEFFLYSRNPDGSLNSVCRRMETILGTEPDDFKKTWNTYFKPRVLAYDGISKTKLNILECLNPQGKRFFMEFYEFATPTNTGEINIHGMALNVTSKIINQQKLKNSENRFRALTQFNPIGIFQVDNDNRYSFVNTTWEKITGRKMIKVMDTDWISIIHPEDQPNIQEQFEEAERNQEEFKQECRIQTAGGKTIWVSLQFIILFDDAGKVAYGTLEDISHRKKEEEKKELLITELTDLKEKLEVTARTDPLTGLPNRRGLLRLLELEHSRFRRTGRDFSLLMGDIDHFKKINDTWGHDAGDQVLVTVARTLRNALRGHDQVCRWGGEEFLVLLPETPRDKAAIVAEKLRATIESLQCAYEGKEIPVTLSLGGSTVDNMNKDPQDCIKEADECMYEAKHGGRNCYKIAEPE